MICPQCKKNELLEPIVRNSLSRADNQTYICNDCGNQEGFDDLDISLTDELLPDQDGERRVYDVLQTLTNKAGEYIPIICIENEPGYHKTSWTWGKDFQAAQKIARKKNLALGYDAKAAYQIIATTYRQGV